MKKLFFIAALLLSISFYAQPPEGGGRRPTQGQNQQGEEREVRKFKASDAAGIFYYEIEKVVKKVKIKDDVLKAKISKFIKNYNHKIREISFLNSVNFSDLDVIVNSKSLRKNEEGRAEMRKNIDKIIRPVRDSIHENEIDLNQNFESVLSEKQLKKWLKLQKRIKESLQPKKVENRDQQGSRSGGNGRPQRRQ